MMLILLLLAIGAILLVVSMILMWYLFLVGFTLIVILGSLSYWFTFMLVEELTNNMELAPIISISVAALTILGMIVWAYRGGKFGNEHSRP
jgi:hypothetical protein